MKWLYAAYKLGSFGDGDLISLDEGMTPSEFDQKLRLLMSTYYEDGWVLESMNQGKMRPVGVIFSTYMGPLNLLGDMTWFPWSTDRNRVEAAVHFLNEARRHAIYVWYCDFKDKRFYEHIARHGIIKRIGSITGLYKGGDVPFWQTRV